MNAKSGNLILFPAIEVKSREQGSAVAEFVMITTLLVVIAITVIQLALVLHVKNTITDAAANGAHYGALANRAPSDAMGRTKTLISTALNERFANDIDVTVYPIGDGQLVTVTVHTKVPLVGLLPTGWDLTVRADAVRYE
ncbi:pilus assembly protein [Glutamicibacter sp.]|uniref:TadE family protein n=1 Tax=Glutamicibacter sp. TaxID=1931995 RepID=UPI0028BE26F2|nr:pilus assembly protein [Glutamicibacter sp.]